MEISEKIAEANVTAMDVDRLDVAAAEAAHAVMATTKIDAGRAYHYVLAYRRALLARQSAK